MRGDPGGVKTEIGRESHRGKLLQPIDRGMHVDMRRFGEVAGRRGKQDDVAGRRHVGDRAAGFIGSQVFQHFNASDHIVAALNRMSNRTHPAIRTDIFADILNGEFRNVDAPGLDAPVAQRFHQKAQRAPRIEYRLGLQILDQRVGHRAEKLHPVLIVFVRRGPEAAVVILGVIDPGSSLAGSVFVWNFAL